MAKGCLLAAIVLHLVYVIEGDNSCSEPCLIYSATTEIKAIELSTLRSVHLVPNLQRAVALDVHVSERTFYWSDIKLHVIKRMNMSSGIIEDIITDDLGSVEGLAIEWESNLIYWSDYSNSRIEVASLDGSNRKLLFIEEVDKPRGIALYPKKGLMFWTDWGSTPKIERASLAGLDRTLLVDLTSSSQFWPVAVFVDYTEDRVYWIDAYDDVIDSTDLNGQNRRKLSDRVHPTRNILPFDFTVYGDTLYWGDWYSDTIEKLNWTTAEYLGGFGVLTSDRVFGLALLDQSRQPASAGNQLCKINNGGCSHLCLLTPDGFVCACPSGLPLLPDGKNCLKDVTRFLLFAEGRNIRQLELHFNSSSSLRIPLTEPTSSPVALDYNFKDEKVYWTDVGNDTISRAFLNGSSQETIVSTRLRNPYGLAVDSFGQNIYWTESYEEVIEVASLNGLYRRVLIKDDLQDPRDIALDVTRGFMYWTDWGIDERIEKADMDGTNRTIVIRTGIYFPSGLALDVAKNWLYWVDWYYDKLEVYEFPSQSRREIISSHSEPFLSSPLGLALYGNHLYWTDRTWRGIYGADRETGENVEKILSTQSRPTLIHAYEKNKTVTPVTDQCNINNGGCSHLCLLTPVGRKCSCSEGFALEDDEKRCSKLPVKPFLLFADATYGRIMKVSSQDSGSLTSLPLENPIRRPVALAYDTVDDRVYWTDVTMKTISRAFLNGSSQEVIHGSKVQRPDGLAVDIIGRNLYWTDTGTNKLEVSKLNGSFRMPLVTSDLDQPRDIVLDVDMGVMYWTDWGTFPKIEKAEMTGKQRNVIVNTGLVWPNGLTLDSNKHRLYWVDARYDKLEYLDLNQNNRVTLISSSYYLPHPFGLTILGDYLYWTDWQRYAVYGADKETGGDITRFVTGIGKPMDIHGYNLSEYSTTRGNSTCQLNNGGCSHICLLSSTGSGCACPGHLTLSGDGKTCEHYLPQKFLLFADASQAEILVLSLDGSIAEAKPVPIELNIRRPVALGLDMTENRIYWTDVTLNTISRVFINGSSPEVLVSENIYSPEGLAVDTLGGNIYWTDTGTNKIEVSRMDGSMRKALISKNLDEPRDIILDLIKGMMYWCDWGDEHKIEVANMDGGNRRILVKRGLYWPNGLTLDDTNRRLYWVDAWFDTLEYYDLERHTITTLSKNSSILPHPFGLTLLENYLYWTDWSLDVVYQAEKNTLSNLKVLVSGLSKPTDIHAYDRNKTLPDHPCSLSYGGCSHLCLLTPDGYHCSCPDNLTLSEDEKTCIPHKYVFQKFLVFADASQAEIFVLPLDGSSLGTTALPIGQNMYRPVALGLDITDNRIYWTDVSLNRISRAFINGSSPEVIVSLNVFTPDGLAVDPLGKNIYWTDTGTNKIEVSRMDGSMRKTLIDQDLDKPRDIILDLNKGLMYWCDWGSKPKIELANMDGDGRRVLVKRALYWPNGLTLDDLNNRLYWVDAYLDLLEYYDLKLHTVTTLLEDSSMLIHPFGLTSIDDQLYWTDWYSDAVYQADKKTASNAKILVSGLSQPMDIHAYDRNKTLPDHPCSSSYGGCSHLCLLRPDGYHCSCPDHLQSGEVCPSSVVISPSSSIQIKSASTSASQTKTPSFTTSSSYHISVASAPTSYNSSIQIKSASTSASQTKTPSFTASSSYHISVASAPTSYNKPVASSPTSVFNPTSTKQHPSVPSTSERPTPLSPTECRPNTCKNGGTCVVPGYFCVCTKYYVWNLCVVYVGSSAVEIELTFPNEKQWIEFNFRVAVAKACTNFFCKSGECKSKSGRVKRSEGAKYFQDSDVKVLGLSPNGDNTWKIEFAVLLPSVDGKAPQPSPPDGLVRMVYENKKTIEKAVGGSIEAITIGKQPEQPKKGEKSTQDKGASSVPVAAGVGSIVIVLILVAAFVIYRMRRKRRLNNRPADDIQLENDWVTDTNSHTTFDNPMFNEDPMYDSISRATGGSVAEKIRQVNEDDGSNGISNPTYAVANYGDHGIEDPEIRNASLEKEKESNLPQHTATDDDSYEKMKCEEESHA